LERYNAGNVPDNDCVEKLMLLLAGRTRRKLPFHW
jgi:hypothetical protein